MHIDVISKKEFKEIWKTRETKSALGNYIKVNNNDNNKLIKKLFKYYLIIIKTKMKWKN